MGVGDDRFYDDLVVDDEFHLLSPEIKMRMGKVAGRIGAVCHEHGVVRGPFDRISRHESAFVGGLPVKHDPFLGPEVVPDLRTVKGIAACIRGQGVK